MKFRDLLNEIGDHPDLADYDIQLSKYLVIPIENETGIEREDSLVVDIPVRGIAINDSSKEIRFVISDSDAESMENIELNYSDLPIDEPETDD